MKISEQIKRLGNGLIERTTVETEIDTKIRYIPIHKAFDTEINQAFADAGMMICALSDRVNISYDTNLNGEYELWETYRSNLYDNQNRLVYEDALCHRKEKRTFINFLYAYQNICNPEDKADVGFRIMCAMSQLITNEEELSKLWEDNEVCVYVMGKERGKNNLQIFPETMAKDKSMEFYKRLKSFDKNNVEPSAYPFALLLSIGQKDSEALKYFKANPQALESILIGNREWMAENIKLKHTVSKSAITNEVEDRYDFIFNN